MVSSVSFSKTYVLKFGFLYKQPLDFIIVVYVLNLVSRPQFRNFSVRRFRNRAFLPRHINLETINICWDSTIPRFYLLLFAWDQKIVKIFFRISIDSGKPVGKWLFCWSIIEGLHCHICYVLVVVSNLLNGFCGENINLFSTLLDFCQSFIAYAGRYVWNCP